MLLFKGALVSLLLPLWAAIGLLAVGAASFAVSTAEDPSVEQQVLDLGFGGSEATTLESALGIAVVAVFAVHVIAAVATSRAVAAMAGSLGGLLGTALAGVAAIALALSPSGDRTDALQALTQPAAVAAIGFVSLILGFRAYLAHTGRWRYAKRDDADTWGDDFGD